MGALDYSFLESEESEGLLDYSFMDETEPEPLDQKFGEARPVDRNIFETAVDDIKFGYAGFKKNLSQQMGMAFDDTDEEKISRGVRLKELERKESVNAPDTDVQQKLQEISEAGSMSDALGLMWEYPDAVASVTLSSLGRFAPALAAMGGTAAATGGATIPVMGTTFMGSLATEYGATMDETIRESGMNPEDPLSWKKAINDDELIAGARERGLKRGIPIAAFDMLSMGLAGKLLAGAKPTAASLLTRSTGELGMQAGLGAAGETAAQIVDTGDIESFGEIALEGFAELGPGIVETAIGFKGQKRAATDRGSFDQSTEPPELFNPTHKAGGGQDAQVVTKNGEIIPDTYMNAQGETFRDANAVPTEPVDLSYDVSAVSENIKSEVFSKSGIVEIGTGALSQQIEPKPTPTETITEPAETNAVESLAAAQPKPVDTAAVEKIATERRSKANEKLAWAPDDERRQSKDIGPEMTPKPKQTRTELPGDEVATTPKQEALKKDQAKKKESIKPTIEESTPTVVNSAEELHEEANKAATSPLNEKSLPTEAQIASNDDEGNYAKGHPVYDGLKISIENPAGSKRRPEWPALRHHYGDIKGTKGADGDSIDVFINKDDKFEDSPVFVVNQVDPKTRKFNETKILLGFSNKENATIGYNSNYEKDWKGLGDIHQSTMNEFKDWLKNGDTTKRYDSRAAREALSARISDLASDEGKVSQSSKQKLQELRRTRDKGLPALDEQLSDVLPGHGESTGNRQGVADRKKKQQQGVQSEQLPLGNEEGANEEHENQSLSDPQRTENASGRMGGIPENKTKHALPQNIRVPMDDGKSVNNTSGRSEEKFKDDNIPRENTADGGLGEGTGNKIRNAKKSNDQTKLVGEESADAVTKPDLLARREDPYTAMEGKDISYEVEVEDDGKTYKVTVDAATVMRETDARIDSLKQLRDCI